MDKPLFRLHPIGKMLLSVLLTALAFPSWRPQRLALVCLVPLVLMLCDRRRDLVKRLCAALLICGAMALISWLLARDTAASIAIGLHFLVLLFCSFWMFQTSPSELLRGLQSCRIPDQLLLGFLVMFRFVDVLRAELTDIVLAGSMIPRGRLTPGKKLYRTILVPFSYRLFVLSDQLNLSIQSREFGSAARTQYRENKISTADVLVFVLAGAASVGILCL